MLAINTTQNAHLKQNTINVCLKLGTQKGINLQGNWQENGILEKKKKNTVQMIKALSLFDTLPCFV